MSGGSGRETGCSPSLRRPILRGRKVFDDDDDDDEFCSEPNVSKSFLKDSFISDVGLEVGTGQTLLKQRELLELKKREGRENHSDFNIVTDVAPEPSFGFSTDLSSDFCETKEENSSVADLIKSICAKGTSVGENNNESLSAITETKKADVVPSSEATKELEEGTHFVNTPENVTVEEDNLIFENTKSLVNISQFRNQNGDSHMSFEEQEEFQNLACAPVSSHVESPKDDSVKDGETRNTSLVEKPDFSTSQLGVTVNRSPSLSAILCENNMMENSSSEASNQDASVSKYSFNSTRDRLLYVLHADSKVNLVGPKSKTLLSFKTPQRATRVSFMNQKTNEKDCPLTSTPKNTPKEPLICRRFEDHHNKFRNSIQKSACCGNTRSDKGDVAHTLTDSNISETVGGTEMISLSPSTRILKAVV
uniref:Tower domain-containing protein n=1 Tax=Syphacia muris TaxID=451379 RepID=A0A0N5B1L1_9BILA